MGTEAITTPTLNIIEAGLARCVTEPRGANGLDGSETLDTAASLAVVSMRFART